MTHATIEVDKKTYEVSEEIGKNLAYFDLDGIRVRVEHPQKINGKVRVHFGRETYFVDHGLSYDIPMGIHVIRVNHS